MAIMQTQKGRIASGGCGGFLNPPSHPEHSLHVETSLRRRPENRDILSLSYAAKCQWLDRETRHAVRCRLNSWKRSRPSIEDPDIQDWIMHVLGYFRGCYVGGSGSRNADDLLISRTLDPMENADKHAGVLFVRDFYPDFVPTPAHFAGAYWGSKPAG
jgi:hypothetical protein